MAESGTWADERFHLAAARVLQQDVLCISWNPNQHNFTTPSRTSSQTRSSSRCSITGSTTMTSWRRLPCWGKALFQTIACEKCAGRSTRPPCGGRGKGRMSRWRPRTPPQKAKRERRRRQRRRKVKKTGPGKKIVKEDCLQER